MSGPFERPVVAFLRGMNLGGHRITNAELERHLSAAGLEGVTAYQASGNVVFEAPDLPPRSIEALIETRLEESLGYEVPTFVRAMSTLRGLAGLPGPADAEAEGFKVHVLFLRHAAPEGLADELRELETPDDRLRVSDRHVLWYRRGRLKESTIPLEDTGSLTGGQPHTMRTLGTVRRIVKKFDPERTR